MSDPRPAPVLKPKEAAHLASIGIDREFGRILMYGRPARWPMLVFGSMGPLVFGVGGIGATLSGLSANAASANRPDLYIGLALLAFALVQIVVIVWWLWKNSFEWRFYEQGVVKWRRARGDVARLSYMDVTAILYKRVRTHMHGVYVGTSGVIELDVAKGSVNGSRHKPVKYSFKHREKAVGIFNRTISGTDPMDLVRDAVAEFVAERLAVEIAEKGMAVWVPRVLFTREGLAVKKLVGGERHLPYEKVRAVDLPNDQIGIQIEQETRAGAVLDEKSKNFWPGLVLFQRLAPDLEPPDEWDEDDLEED